MNRTQRAIKKKCRQSLEYAKQRKRDAIYEMMDCSMFGNGGYREAVVELSKEEKDLRKWHRKIKYNNNVCQTNALEVAGA